MKGPLKIRNVDPHTGLTSIVDADGKGVCLCDAKNAPAFLASLELLEIAKAYRNLLRTMASTEGEVRTFHHVEGVIAKAEMPIEVFAEDPETFHGKIRA